MYSPQIQEDEHSSRHIFNEWIKANKSSYDSFCSDFIEPIIREEKIQTNSPTVVQETYFTSVPLNFKERKVYENKLNSWNMTADQSIYQNYLTENSTFDISYDEKLLDYHSYLANKKSKSATSTRVSSKTITYCTRNGDKDENTNNLMKKPRFHNKTNTHKPSKYALKDLPKEAFLSKSFSSIESGELNNFQYSSLMSTCRPLTACYEPRSIYSNSHEFERNIPKCDKCKFKKCEFNPMIYYPVRVRSNNKNKNVNIHQRKTYSNLKDTCFNCGHTMANICSQCKNICTSTKNMSNTSTNSKNTYDINESKTHSKKPKIKCKVIQCTKSWLKLNDILVETKKNKLYVVSHKQTQTNFLAEKTHSCDCNKPKTEGCQTDNTHQSSSCTQTDKTRFNDNCLKENSILNVNSTNANSSFKIIADPESIFLENTNCTYCDDYEGVE